MRKLLAPSLLALAGCADGSSCVVVTLTSGMPLTVDSFDITAVNAGSTATSSIRPATSLQIPPDASFALKLDRSRTGDLSVEVRALAKSGEVARASGKTAIVVGGTASLTLALTPTPRDMGVGGDSFGDDGALDAATPKKLAFAAPVSYPAGMGTGPVAMGDFDGDGAIDIIAANSTSNDLSVFLGKGDGTLRAAVGYPTVNSPLDVAVADFDRDGKSDVLVSSSVDSVVKLYLANLNGTLRAGVSVNSGMASRLMAVGDPNSDGKFDFAVSDGASGVRILLGMGDGTFQNAVSYAAGMGTNAVVLADFDGDQKSDLVVTDSTSNDVALLRGTGDGTFGAAKQVGVAGTPDFTAVGDIDRDGRADLVVVTFGTKEIAVLRGMGGGTFTTTTLPVGSTLWAVAIADFDLDGNLDLVVSIGPLNSVGIYLGRGDGSFQPGKSFPVGANPRRLVVGDLNRDGLPDIATANFGSNDITVVLNTSG